VGFFKISQLSYEVVRKTFFADFSFRNFGPQAILQKLWRHLASKMQTMECIWKNYFLRKKGCKLHWNRPINCDAMFVRTMHPRTLSTPDLEWHIKEQTPHFHTYSWSASYDLHQTLHG